MNDKMGRETDHQMAKKMRLVSLTIAGTMVLWIAAQWIGGQFGITPRFQVLIDLIAIGAFMWAIVVIYQIWRARQGS